MRARDDGGLRTPFGLHRGAARYGRAMSDHDHDDHDHDHDHEGHDHDHEGHDHGDGGPRDQLNELLNGAVEIAAELLAEDGEFEPFAIALRLDGELMHLTSDAGEPSPDGEGPDPDAVVESLRTTLRERKDELVCCAIIADVTLEDEDEQATTAAIAISLEHRVEDPVSCFVPYEINEKDELGLADLLAEPAERTIFPAPANN